MIHVYIFTYTCTNKNVRVYFVVLTVFCHKLHVCRRNSYERYAGAVPIPMHTVHALLKCPPANKCVQCEDKRKYHAVECKRLIC